VVADDLLGQASVIDGVGTSTSHLGFHCIKRIKNLPQASA
jgi:hypothetical protein